jgi:hypothetical protein
MLCEKDTTYAASVFALLRNNCRPWILRMLK